MTDSSMSLAHEVKDMVANIPSDVTDAMIENYISDAINDVSNYSGEGIDRNDIPAKYVSILKNLGAAYLRSRLTGVGVDFNMAQGEISISRGQESSMHAQMIQYHLDRVNQSLRMIGRKIRYKKVY